jgi:hypothetical protein
VVRADDGEAGEAQTTAGKVGGWRVCDVNDSVATKDELTQTMTRL